MARKKPGEKQRNRQLMGIGFAKHVQRPLQLLHLQLSVHSVQMGLVRTESQSPEPSARSNLGEIPPSLSLQRLFPISSSPSLQGPDVSTSVLNCWVTSCLPVIQAQSAKYPGGPRV